MSVAHLGASLREARRHRALTQAQLASSAQVSRAFIISLERGHHERAELGKVLAVFQALDMDLVPEARSLNDAEPTLDERSEALGEMLAEWERGNNAPDAETQQITRRYVSGQITTDEAIALIDALDERDACDELNGPDSSQLRSRDTER